MRTKQQTTTRRATGRKSAIKSGARLAAAKRLEIASAPQRPVPIYVRIEERIREMIAARDLAPGDRVPSERALAEATGANRMTVRKAMDRLVIEGVLERAGTSGTRVALPRVNRPLSAQVAQGISRVVEGGGAASANRLLDFQLASADAKLAQRLGVAKGEELVVFRRLWTVDTAPFCIETSHIPAALVPGLHAEDLAASQSLYDLLRSRYSIKTAAGERIISIAPSTAMEARLLGLKPGTSILLLRLLSFDVKGRPIEYTTSVNHPRLVAFKTAKAELTW